MHNGKNAIYDSLFVFSGILTIINQSLEKK